MDKSATGLEIIYMFLVAGVVVSIYLIQFFFKIHIILLLIPSISNTWEIENNVWLT